MTEYIYGVITQLELEDVQNKAVK